MTIFKDRQQHTIFSAQADIK